MATQRNRRNPVTTISEPLLRFLCGEDFREGIPTGGLPEDVCDFYYFATNQRRRDVYAAALPEMVIRCKQLGRPVPTFSAVLAAHGIPHHDKETKDG